MSAINRGNATRVRWWRLPRTARAIPSGLRPGLAHVAAMPPARRITARGVASTRSSPPQSLPSRSSARLSQPLAINSKACRSLGFVSTAASRLHSSARRRYSTTRRIVVPPPRNAAQRNRAKLCEFPRPRRRSPDTVSTQCPSRFVGDVMNTAPVGGDWDERRGLLIRSSCKRASPAATSAARWHAQNGGRGVATTSRR